MTNVLTEEKIRAVLNGTGGYTELSAAGDWRGVSELYALGAVYMINGEIVATSRAQIRERLREEYAIPGRVSPQVATGPIDVAEYGLSAFVSEDFQEASGACGKVHMTLTVEDGKPRIALESIIMTS